MQHRRCRCFQSAAVIVDRSTLALTKECTLWQHRTQPLRATQEKHSGFWCLPCRLWRRRR